MLINGNNYIELYFKIKKWQNFVCRPFIIKGLHLLFRRLLFLLHCRRHFRSRLLCNTLIRCTDVDLVGVHSITVVIRWNAPKKLVQSL